MKTNPSNPKLVLRDGKAIIGRWSPGGILDLTIGGRVGLPLDIMRDPQDTSVSYETASVIRFHPFDSRPGVSMAELNQEIRSHLHGLLEPAML